MKKKIRARVISQREIGKDIFDLVLDAPEIAHQAVPGQFVSVYCQDGSRILPRPISLCEITDRTLRLVYRIAGAGTREISGCKAGDTLEILGPLGNGFSLEEKGRAFLIGGGIGIPPMLELAKRLPGAKQVLLGYRDERFLMEDFLPYGEVFAATEDGSFGTKGTVMDAIRENHLEADVIYACGPKPMLKAIKAYAAEHGIPAYISMEERMACGVGACLACVCTSTEVDEHTNQKNKRICKDGPVFEAQEVVL